jgi:hypothetical protein
MPLQPAITIRTVVNVVSSISGIAMPSTPRWYSEFNIGIQGVRSTNCMSALPALKCVYSGMLATKVAKLVTSDSHRASCARFSPRASATTPPMIGSQINKLSRCGLVAMFHESNYKPAPRHNSQNINEAKPRIIANA